MKDKIYSRVYQDIQKHRRFTDVYLERLSAYVEAELAGKDVSLQYPKICQLIKQDKTFATLYVETKRLAIATEANDLPELDDAPRFDFLKFSGQA